MNTQVWLFNPAAVTWVDSGASLAKPLDKDTAVMRAAMVMGDDGSRNLYTFDTSLSPNVVQRVVLMDGNGTPIQNAAPVKRQLADDGLRSSEKRAAATLLTEGSWPGYNATLAPSVTRNNCALAQDPNGLVVIAGGNPDDVLCIFDGRRNGWENAAARFVNKAVTDDITTLGFYHVQQGHIYCCFPIDQRPCLDHGLGHVGRDTDSRCCWFWLIRILQRF